MQPIHRRNFLQWIGAVFGSALIWPGKTKAAPPAAMAVADPRGSAALLRTEHFEGGHVTLQTADTKSLALMLGDLQERREHDRACHSGEAGPHFDYLSGWISSVTQELQSRGHHVDL